MLPYVVVKGVPDFPKGYIPYIAVKCAVKREAFSERCGRLFTKFYSFWKNLTYI